MHYIMNTNRSLRTLGALVLFGIAGLQAAPGSTPERAPAIAAARSGDWANTEAVLAQLAMPRRPMWRRVFSSPSVAWS